MSTLGEPAQRIVLVDSADATIAGGPAVPIAILPGSAPTSGAPPLRAAIVVGRATLGGPALPVVVVADPGVGGPVLPVTIV